MSNKSPLNLRVRLKPHQRKVLEDIAIELGGEQNISTVVRKIIEDFQDIKKSKIVCLTQAHYEKLMNFSVELGRDPNEIANECILAVEEMLKGERPPLIVEELKLRRKYTKKQKQGKNLLRV
jgi:hypothetical protein